MLDGLVSQPLNGLGSLKSFINRNAEQLAHRATLHGSISIPHKHQTNITHLPRKCRNLGLSPLI